MSNIWKDPAKELPQKEGEIVWVMTQHWKTPLSLEIYCGEVEFSSDGTVCRVNTNDMTGKGSWCIYLTEADSYSEQGMAWCNIQLPSFIETDPHWEKNK